MSMMCQDQEALYDLFVEFMQNNDGVEVTEEDCLEAFRKAKIDTDYFLAYTQSLRLFQQYQLGFAQPPVQTRRKNEPTTTISNE